MVVKEGDKAKYPTERILQSDRLKGRIKGVKWVKTYRLWKREDGEIIPLSNGWSLQTALSVIQDIPVSPPVGVFE